MRMNEMSVTVPKLAKSAGIDGGTIRSLLAGKRWPVRSTLQRLDRALGWSDGEITRRAQLRPELYEFEAIELLAELYRRAREGELIQRAG